MVSSSETESSKNHDPKILSQYPHNLMYAQNMMNMASQQAYQWDMYGFMLSQQLQVQQLQQQVQLMQHMQSTSNIMNALMGNGVGVFSNEQDAKLVAGMQNMNSVQQQVFNAATSVPGNGTSSASGTNQQQPQGTSFDSTQNKNNNAAAAAQPQMDLLNFGNADANANANNANVVAPANNNDNAAANGANPANANAAAANGDAANPANQNIWARFRIGSIVKVALIMLLLEVKPVWFFVYFFAVFLYLGGIFDPILEWFKRHAAQQPLEAQLRGIRQRQEEAVEPEDTREEGDTTSAEPTDGLDENGQPKVTNIDGGAVETNPDGSPKSPSALRQRNAGPSAGELGAGGTSPRAGERSPSRRRAEPPPQPQQPWVLRFMYQLFVMFVMTLLPMWNPDPQYLQ